MVQSPACPPQGLLERTDGSELQAGEFTKV
jgi:hypothetical protein